MALLGRCPGHKNLSQLRADENRSSAHLGIQFQDFGWTKIVCQLAVRTEAESTVTPE